MKVSTPVLSVLSPPQPSPWPTTPGPSPNGSRIWGPAVVAGQVVFVRQPEEGVTYAPKVDKDELVLRPEEPADAFVRRVRAFSPRPGAYLLIGGRRLKVLAATALEGDASPGTVLRRGAEVVIGTEAGLVRLDRVQPEGGRPMPASDWLRGLRDLPAAVD